MTRHRRPSLERVLRMPRRSILGLNSGTSLDGLDLCLLQVSGTSKSAGEYTVLATDSVRFPKRVRESLWDLANAQKVDKHQLLHTQMEYTVWVARCVDRFRESAATGHQIDALAFHGQTIAHYPEPRKSRTNTSSTRWRGDTTWQLGSGPALSYETGLVTVSDFRTIDIAAGGMGAPLSGYYHYLLFGDRCAVLNLGGIANISVTQSGTRTTKVLAFDIGPGNMIVDLVAQDSLGRPYDRNGRVAMTGQPIETVVKRASAHPYFRRKPPKTCGREQFGSATVLDWFGPSTHSSAADRLATAVQITARQIARAVTLWVQPFSPVRRLLLAGGGVRNRALVAAIRLHLPDWEIDDSSAAGIPPQYVEPAGFAALASETLSGREGNIGGATGASAAVLGTISIPMVT
jgi:anhydro-N-acetylmuramic acid kinase